MSYDNGLLKPNLSPEVLVKGQGIDGIHWNIILPNNTPHSVQFATDAFT